MTIPLRVLASNDSFGVLNALTDVLDAKCALFVQPTLGTFAEQQVDENVALIVESSGSTGHPKRIELSRDALTASANASIERIGEPGQWLLALPVHYIAGLQVLVRSILSDIQPVLMNTSVPFTAEGFVRSAALMTASNRYTSLVPAQLDTLAASIEKDESVLAAMKSFDRILIGGQAPNAQTIERLRNLGVILTVTYGMTETCGGCVYDGVPLTGVVIDIDESGQIWIAGPVLANGIGEKFATADLGSFDEANRLNVIGRSDRVINSGGIKLALDRVEAWARSQVGVASATAVPIEHEKFGQTFACWYTSSDTTAETAPLSAERAKADLGLAAKHSIWRRVESIPVLSNGKPDLVAIERAQRELASSRDN